MLERTNLRPGTSSRSIVFIPFLRSLLLSGGVPPLDERKHSRELIEPFHSTRRLTIEPFQSFQRLLVVRARVFIQKKKKEEKTKQRSRVRSRFPRDARSSCIVEQSTILGSKAGTEIHPSIYFPRGWKSGRIVRLNGGWCSSTAVRLEFPSHTRVCPPIYERVHAPLYTRAQVRALTQYAPYIRAYLGGEVAKGLQGNCNTTDVAAVCKAVYYTVSHAGISKRNTSGFAIVLRICSPIHNLPPPSHLSSFDTRRHIASFPASRDGEPIFFVDPIASLTYETRIAIDPWCK